MRAPRGFVLVLVLAMLVILSLLAGGIATTAARLRDQQEDRNRQLQAALDMHSTRATLIYMLTTHRTTYAGLTVDDRVPEGTPPDTTEGVLPLPMGGEIAYDGRVYEGLGQTRFSLQDDRGLLGINWVPLPMLEGLLKMGGAPQTVPVETLAARLLDYQDPDDLYRLNSMERDGYLKAGLPPPSNRPLTMPGELLRVAGWREALGTLADGRLLDLVSTDEARIININTAPADVLQLMPGFDRAMADRVVARRRITPFLNWTEFAAFVGLEAYAEAGGALYPSPSGTLRLWSAQGGHVELTHWTLTPFENGDRPWREDYALVIANTQPPDAPALKPASALFAQPVAASR